MIAEGQPAPDFELLDQDGNAVRLSSLRGQTVVLYFYPAALTPGCTMQACGIRDRHEDFEHAGAVVLGVSPDKPRRLKRFAGMFGLPFTLLSDPDHEVAREYGTWGRDGVVPQLLTERSTFVIDVEGRIARVLRKVGARTHDQVVIDTLDELDREAVSAEAGGAVLAGLERGRERSG